MNWEFERVAGPYNGPLGGVAWDGSGLLFSLISEERILRLDPRDGSIGEFRRYTTRTNGIAFGADGVLYGCQEGGRRIVQYPQDGSARTTTNHLDGRMQNHPYDLTLDSAGRVWFSDPYHPVPAYGPQMDALLEHASVLRLERDNQRHWRLVRMTFDTKAPRAVLLAEDERTLFLSEGETTSAAPRELRAYSITSGGTLAPCHVLHTFGSDVRGPHRGIEGMCLESGGNMVACAGWKQSGPGPMIYVFSPAGVVLHMQPLPFDVPSRCAFGDAGLDTLYISSLDGTLHRAKNTGLCGRSAKHAG